MLSDSTTKGAAALIDATTGKVTTYGALRDQCSRVADRLGGRKALALIYLDRSTTGLAAYLSLLANRCPVLVLNPRLPVEDQSAIEDVYQPSLVLSAADGFDIHEPMKGIDSTAPLHPELALLLPTSGSTGRPKMVRLSWRNIQSNALAIKDSLRIAADDIAITSLPTHYAYGLSVVHSHVAAGASLLVTATTPMQERFWVELVEGGATTCAATPSGWRIMLDAGLERRGLAGLRCLTSAGGALPDGINHRMVELASQHAGCFHQMYGQTEASPRMACMPADYPPDKIGSAGIALPGGRIAIRNERMDNLAQGDTGAVWYQGPNVMMGYADSRADLGRGDVQGEWLRTGDTGRLDSDGFLWITGRDVRFVKPHGIRIALDDIERELDSFGESAVVGVRETVHVFIWGTPFDPARAQEHLARRTGVPRTVFVFHAIESAPITPAGKVDYLRLTELAESSE